MIIIIDSWRQIFSLLLSCCVPNFLLHDAIPTTRIPRQPVNGLMLYLLWHFRRLGVIIVPASRNIQTVCPSPHFLHSGLHALIYDSRLGGGGGVGVVELHTGQVTSLSHGSLPHCHRLVRTKDPNQQLLLPIWSLWKQRQSSCKWLLVVFQHFYLNYLWLFDVQWLFHLFSWSERDWKENNIDQVPNLRSKLNVRRSLWGSDFSLIIISRSEFLFLVAVNQLEGFSLCSGLLLFHSITKRAQSYSVSEAWFTFKRTSEINMKALTESNNHSHSRSDQEPI